MTNTIEQKVTKEENWLTYKEEGAEESVNNRLFGKIISRPDGSQPWDEWTAEQYDEWHSKYNPQPEPPEPEDAEIIEEQPQEE